MSVNIAYIGTGLLGAALAEMSARRGDHVVAWNRTIAKARALEPFGVQVAATPAEAVRGARRVHLVLKDDAVVEDVVAALRPGLATDAIIVDHTTTQPALTARRVRRLNSEGVRYLHCPVFIGPAAARQEKGTIMVAGPRVLFDEVHAGLAAMAERVEYFGEEPDAAAIRKLVGNAFIIGIGAVVADVFAMASNGGLEPQDAMKVLDYFNVPAIVTGRGRAMIDQKFTPGFELEMARKDVRLMIETAGSVPLAVLPGIAARMDDLIAAGHGADDLAVLGKR